MKHTPKITKVMYFLAKKKLENLIFYRNRKKKGEKHPHLVQKGSKFIICVNSKRRSERKRENYAQENGDNAFNHFYFTYYNIQLKRMTNNRKGVSQRRLGR